MNEDGDHDVTHTTYDDATTDPDNRGTDVDGGDVILDEDWLATPHRRNRLRMVLLELFVMVLVFFAGVEVHKKFGADSGTAASPFGSGSIPAGLPSGFPSGFPGPGSASGGSTGRTDTSPANAGDSDTSAAPAVIGKVLRIKGDTWVIRDLGGTKRQVSVSQDTTITQESKVHSDAVKPGSSVTVSGSTDAGGQVAATDVTVR